MSAETPRTRRLEPGDEERLLKHAGPHLRALIVAALSTGCRIGELLSLQWHQIRYDEKGVVSRPTVGGRRQPCASTSADTPGVRSPRVTRVWRYASSGIQ